MTGMRDVKRPIAVPWNVRLRHLGIHWLQLPVFVVSLGLLAWMWTGRASTVILVGQAEAVQVSVGAPDSGILLRLDEPIAAFDRVAQDVTLIARIDVADSLSEMQTLTAERNRLNSLLVSEAERLRLEQRRWDLDGQQQDRDELQRELDRQRNQIGAADQVDEMRREFGELQERRRSLELRQAEIIAQRITDQQQFYGWQRQLDQLRDLVQRGAASSLRLDELESQVVLQQRVIDQGEQLGNAVAQQLVDLQLEISQSQVRAQQVSESWKFILDNTSGPPAGNGELGATIVNHDSLLEPFSRAVAVQDAKIQALAQRIAANEIRAPVSGTVASIHQTPGTYVRSGEAIVTIASEQSRWIVAYLGQAYRGALRPADEVEIRIRGRGNQIRVGRGAVIHLGVQYELVPSHLRRHPDVAEWGLPLRISIPDGLQLLPGEMVELSFALVEPRSVSLF